MKIITIPKYVTALNKLKCLINGKKNKSAYQSIYLTNLRYNVNSILLSFVNVEQQ